MSVNAPHPPALAISFRGLLALYLIVPLCWLLYAVDQRWFAGHLINNLPRTPEYFFILQIIFGTPHIIASNLIMVGHADYWQYYRSKLMKMTVFLALVFGLGSVLLPYWVLYAVVALWTILHVLKQQYGIARGACRLPNSGFYALLTLSVLAGFLTYLGIFVDYRLPETYVGLLQTSIGVLCSALVLIAIWLSRTVTRPLAIGFLWVNPIMIVSSYLLYLEGYYLLAILAPRLIHDLTAYYVYLCHDFNRHHRHPDNRLYQLAQSLRIPTLLVLPALSIALALVLQNYADAWLAWLSGNLFAHPVQKISSLGIIGYLALMHYYTEAFTWKHNSPYRRYLSFKLD
ncbi:MAG: hypothetical protein RQ715_00985 [Methylococcales bacterium]|nr:hypothetical protein [Methylococcales bacterium]